MANNRKGKSGSSEQVKQLMVGLGAMAEMAHSFYISMLKTGASPQEATAAMTAFIQAFWHETAEDGRRKRNGGNNDHDPGECEHGS